MYNIYVINHNYSRRSCIGCIEMYCGNVFSIDFHVPLSGEYVLLRV